MFDFNRHLVNSMCCVVKHLLPSRVEGDSALGALSESRQSLLCEEHHLPSCRMCAVCFVVCERCCLQLLGRLEKCKNNERIRSDTRRRYGRRGHMRLA